MVCFDSRINVILVNSNRNPHQHVLRPFYNLPVDLQEVGPLKGFETKVIIVKVSVINDFTVQTSSILTEERKEIESLGLVSSMSNSIFPIHDLTMHTTKQMPDFVKH